MNMIRLLFALWCIGFLGGCAARFGKPQPNVGEKPSPVVTRRPGDTLVYTISFTDETDRQQFLKRLDSLLSREKDRRVHTDTINGSVTIRVVPLSHPGNTFDSLFIAAIETDEFTETPITPDSLSQADSGKTPGFGGTASLYLHRRFFDNTTVRLVSYIPVDSLPAQTAKPVSPSDFSSAFIDTQCFDPGGRDSMVSKDSTTARTLDFPVPLVAEQPEPDRVLIGITTDLRNADNRYLSSFDLVEAWTNLLREHPAEGFALFPYVSGVRAFLDGTEAAVQGFRVLEEDLIELRFDTGDPYAVQRLFSPRLFPASLKCGPYAEKRGSGSSRVLVSNPSSLLQPGFLDSCRITLDGADNPLLTFSLGKFDVAELVFSRDIAYLQTRMPENAHRVPLSEDRYFCSVRGVSRQHIVRTVRANDMLENYVKADGRVIHRLIHPTNADSSESSTKTRPLPPASLVSTTSRIVFRADDAISGMIAERLLAVLSDEGMTCRLVGCSEYDYGIACVKNDYEIAVGWVPAGIDTSLTEQLRCAALWFDHDMDERQRIETGREIPLFSVRRSLLVKNGFKLFRGKLEGIAEVNTASPDQKQSQ